MSQLVVPTSIDRLTRSEAEPITSAAALAQRVRHYRIGPVEVSVRSPLDWVAAEFHALYRSYEVSDAPRDEFRIDVFARRSPRTLLRYYHILANGEEQFAVRRRSAVLPHVEWALNSLISQYLPGYLQFHAAVMSWRGAGVVFPGSPGRGKTTLAAGLLMRGWAYLSDEFALIDPDSRRLVAYPKALCVKAPAFDTLRAIGVPIDDRNRYTKGFKGRVAMVSPLAIRPDAVSPPCPLKLVILPEYQPGQTPRLEPLSRARAVFELANECFNFGKFRAEAVELLVSVVREARCFRLYTGELNESCALIERALTEPRTEVRG